MRVPEYIKYIILSLRREPLLFPAGLPHLLPTRPTIASNNIALDAAGDYLIYFYYLICIRTFHALLLLKHFFNPTRTSDTTEENQWKSEPYDIFWLSPGRRT